MDGDFANELYSESLELQTFALNPLLTSNREILLSGLDSGSCEDDWDDSSRDLDKDFDLDREWQKRHDQFHTIGYRNGLIAGKEASAQEGFNIGFKQSVVVGFNWGVVRGVASALTCLSDELKERLIQTQETRDKFQDLNKSVDSLSTSDALKMFHEDILTKQATQQSEAVSASSTSRVEEEDSNHNTLESYVGKLESLLPDYPEIKVQLATEYSSHLMPMRTI